MIKRNGIGFIYFAVVVASLLLRIASALDVYSALGVSDTDAFYSCMVQIMIFGVMPISLYFLTVGRREGAKKFLGDFGVKKVKGKTALLVLPLAICMIIVSSGISFAWQNMLALMGYVRTSSPTDYSSIGVLFSELVLVAVLPATFEEIAHRGLLYAGYRECGWKFVLISALYFSLMHQNITQTGYTFFAGACMALAMYYTGSIFPGIFMHFLNNAVSVVGEYVGQNGGFLSFINVIENWIYGSYAGLAVGIVIVIVCAALMALIYYAMRKNAVKDGIIDPRPFAPVEGVKPVYKDIPFILTVVIGVGATTFSLVWGLLR
ncbi:MAG: CPBP family intramembrane metalloprotease [Bacteroides sp.]|nr:CPBP family intramembrane metalloprotease [Bacillota bacterium]MCM1394099.1 CPBP family intramembrane metalloprotease [[Eubacterium] siraeum]MCM1455888.1 CPBP family intramembrane metalloprotease [Bacteroides sp.]